VLHMLATNPATARFISRKLAIRFVGDVPPQTLIDRMPAHSTPAARYLRSSKRSSNRRNCAETIRAKVKTPIEYVFSRAADQLD